MRKIKILIILCIISASCLAARILYLYFSAEQQATVVIPNNVIEENDDTGTENTDENTDKNADTDVDAEKDSTADSPIEAGSNETVATAISLYKGKESDNEKFEVKNMLPGDSEVKYFCVRARHEKDIVLTFRAEVTEQTKRLGEILRIKVTHLETNKILYEGTFDNLNLEGYAEQIFANSEKETVGYYKVEVSLPTSAGNEYQAAMLKADFEWYVSEGLIGPTTGDDSNIVVWYVTWCILLVVIISMILWKINRETRRK